MRCDAMEASSRLVERSWRAPILLHQGVAALYSGRSGPEQTGLLFFPRQIPLSAHIDCEGRS